MFEAILREIEAHDTIILHRHTKPDGDAIGSQVGLKYILRENFPHKRIYAVGDDPKFYGFVEGAEPDAVSDDLYENALAVILDCGGASLISDTRYTKAKRTARIDHHIFAEKIADAEVVDTSFESCCGMVAQLAKESGLRVNEIAAKALYTGMVTDSGRFRFDSTTSRTFALASFLLQTPFDVTDIYNTLYADTYESKRLKAEFILKIRFTGHGVAYIYTTKEELAALDADVFTISRGMVSTMADIEGVSIWCNFTETENGVLCELRSACHTNQPIAAQYRGGGHAKACGATVPDRETAMAMLEDLNKLTGV